MSSWFSLGWEEYFTVVQWDQRGAGKTHLLTDPATIAPTLRRERMIADAEEMAACIRTEFRNDKLFVSGHSWGSFLGLQLATHFESASRCLRKGYGKCYRFGLPSAGC